MLFQPLQRVIPSLVFGLVLAWGNSMLVYAQADPFDADFGTSGTVIVGFEEDADEIHAAVLQPDGMKSRSTRAASISTAYRLEILLKPGR